MTQMISVICFSRYQSGLMARRDDFATQQKLADQYYNSTK